jgi:hypothetical protein
MAKVLAEHVLLFCSIGPLSIVIPLGIFIGRNSIRATRGQLAEDPAGLSGSAREQGGSPLIVPSLEFITSTEDVGTGRAAPA